MTVPTPGRIVVYTLTAKDADATNKRRADAELHRDEHRHVSDGSQIHVGNKVSEGDRFPMMIVCLWGAATENAPVNGQVFLDGNDLLWVTSVSVGQGPGAFAWPVRT